MNAPLMEGLMSLGISREERRPCPFCDGPAFLVAMQGIHQVWCRRDLCARGPIRGTAADAVEAWNTRP